MKKTIKEFGSELITIDCEERLEEKVCIYRFENDIITLVAIGDNLNEACENWIKSDDVSANLFDSWQYAIFEEDSVDHNNLDIKSAVESFDKYMASLTDVEKAAALFEDTKHNYVNWKEIEGE